MLDALYPLLFLSPYLAAMLVLIAIPAVQLPGRDED